MAQGKNKVSGFLSSPGISFLLVICLLAGAINLSCSSTPTGNAPNNVATPSAPPASVINELKTVCQDLPAIPNSTEVSKNEAAQAKSVVYNTIYESNAAPEEIDALFQNSLPAKGWQQTAAEQMPEGIYKLNFRKNNFLIDVEYYNYQFFEKNLYTVKCGWQENS